MKAGGAMWVAKAAGYEVIEDLDDGEGTYYWVRFEGWRVVDVSTEIGDNYPSEAAAWEAAYKHWQEVGR
jgi:hypothetical protein